MSFLDDIQGKHPFDDPRSFPRGNPVMSIPPRAPQYPCSRVDSLLHNVDGAVPGVLFVTILVASAVGYVLNSGENEGLSVSRQKPLPAEIRPISAATVARGNQKEARR